MEINIKNSIFRNQTAKTPNLILKIDKFQDDNRGSSIFFFTFWKLINI